MSHNVYDIGGGGILKAGYDSLASHPCQLRSGPYEGSPLQGSLLTGHE